MKQLKTTDLWRYIFTLVVMLCTSMSYSQDLAQAKALCGNVTAANKAMAKQAGYDLDALCSEAMAVGSAKKAVPEQPKVARKTAATEANSDDTEQVADAVAPVAVVGVGGEKPAKDLKPFGYDLFANAPTTFAPAASIPVSADYLARTWGCVGYSFLR